ncbi:MAG: hypothetical protein COW00_13005 [Bdellovibrio sp. CG12_big_fil_rev_8_21_14_0_65_39_13]|nr:MAG: hypothetical protein COW78_05325 [Bdellovibrio sp. CG22_combo_CG10-13_8_21_14_all_39_27]PIQ58999.1 MAG: hypothetical protein COW00_13005 [Bdellovibrio sp. CG12_big_fil_rev_8_21_14_0_65_39_13]PIR33966.1 MAG: hypothetical protein COV37_14720 [Bdellovibrio sp. CG11_big_fil_rev_8_21_14_0_20_39_38]
MGPEDIKFIRNLNNLSQEEMASRLNCSRSILSRLETGLLELSHDEWFQFKIQFPDWVARTTSNRRARAHFNDFQQALPQQYKNQGQIGFRFVSEFEKWIVLKLGHESLRHFWKTERVEPLLLKDKVRFYPFDLFLRMVQWLKMNGELITEKQLLDFSSALCNDPMWWGQRWTWYSETQVHSRFVTLLESWASNTQNHTASFNFDQKALSSTLSFKPRPFINKDLYFNDAIIGDFVGEWARAWCMSLLNKNATINISKKEDSWFLKIQMKKLH